MGCPLWSPTLQRILTAKLIRSAICSEASGLRLDITAWSCHDAHQPMPSHISMRGRDAAKGCFCA